MYKPLKCSQIFITTNGCRLIVVNIVVNICCFVSSAVNTMEKKLAEYKCDTNEAICLKLGMFHFALFCVNQCSCVKLQCWVAFLISCLSRDSVISTAHFFSGKVFPK